MQNELAEIVAALQAGDADRLDAVQDDTLLMQAIEQCERECPDGLPESAARGLDLAYGMRLIELADTGATDSEAHTFARHLYRVAHDRRRDHLDAMEPRFHARWRGYADVATLLMRLRAHERLHAQVRSAPESWHRVVDTIRGQASDGIGWSALFDAVCAANIGPRTKGGLTHLVARMRDAGWLRTVKTGRTVRVFLGPKAPAPEGDEVSATLVRNTLSKFQNSPVGTETKSPSSLFDTTH
jgi:hypothetical protein